MRYRLNSFLFPALPLVLSFNASLKAAEEPRLTIDAIYSEQGLDGTLMEEVAFSPDERYATFLKPKNVCHCVVTTMTAR